MAKRARDAPGSVPDVYLDSKRAIPESNFLGFYLDNLEPVRDAIFRVLPFLNKGEAKRMLAVWDRYRRIAQEYRPRELG